jgi:hypothetical protein
LVRFRAAIRIPRAEEGVKDAEVITSRIVQNDRGWLRLAG